MMKHIQSILGAIIVAVMISGCVHTFDFPETTKVTYHDLKAIVEKTTTNPDVINELKTFLSSECKWRRKNPFSIDISFQRIVFWSGNDQVVTINDDYEYLRFGKYRAKLTEDKRKTFNNIIRKMRNNPNIPQEETEKH
jgi:hypothetical protein